MSDAEATPAAPAKKERKPKAEAPYVVGQWHQEENGKFFFMPLDTQPEKPITEIAELVAWMNKTYGKQPGTYEFIRKHPHKMVIAEQQVFSTKMV